MLKRMNKAERRGEIMEINKNIKAINVLIEQNNTSAIKCNYLEIKKYGSLVSKINPPSTMQTPNHRIIFV